MGVDEREIKPAWLMRDGDVVAAAEVATTRRARRKGITARSDFHGAFVLAPCRHVHTFGLDHPIDVAFCADDGSILWTGTIRPWRLSRLVRGARWVIEAEAGAFDRWGLEIGDQLEVVDEARGERPADK